MQNESSGSSNPPSPERPELDDDLLKYAEEVFELARDGDAVTLEGLLAKGLPANLRNHKGDSLLMLASYYGHLDAVKVLLAHKADPQVSNDRGQTPLAGAAFKGDLGIVQALIEHGADVEGASPDGRTALMMAAMFNRVEIVKYLLAHGAAADAKDAGGTTAHDAALKMGAPDTPGLLAKAQ